MHCPVQSPAESISEVQARVDPYTPPVIVFGENNDDAADQILSLLQASAVRYAPVLNRLLDETVVLLHRVRRISVKSSSSMLEEARSTDPVLAGKNSAGRR